MMNASFETQFLEDEEMEEVHDVAKLHIFPEGGAEIVHVLKPGQFSIGRSADRTDITVKCVRELSRKHAIIDIQDPAYGRRGRPWIFIRDLGTNNGTFVNETRLTGDHMFPVYTKDVMNVTQADVVKFANVICSFEPIQFMEVGEEPSRFTNPVLGSMARSIDKAVKPSLREERLVAQAVIDFLSKRYPTTARTASLAPPTTDTEIASLNGVSDRGNPEPEVVAGVENADAEMEADADAEAEAEEKGDADAEEKGAVAPEIGGGGLSKEASSAEKDEDEDGFVSAKKSSHRPRVRPVVQGSDTEGEDETGGGAEGEGERTGEADGDGDEEEGDAVEEEGERDGEEGEGSELGDKEEGVVGKGSVNSEEGTGGEEQSKLESKAESEGTVFGVPRPSPRKDSVAQARQSPLTPRNSFQLSLDRRAAEQDVHRAVDLIPNLDRDFLDEASPTMEHDESRSAPGSPPTKHSQDQGQQQPKSTDESALSSLKKVSQVSDESDKASSQRNGKGGKSRDMPVKGLTKQQIKGMKIAELREELEARGLDQKGRKAECVKRLLEAVGLCEAAPSAPTEPVVSEQQPIIDSPAKGKRAHEMASVTAAPEAKRARTAGSGSSVSYRLLFTGISPNKKLIRKFGGSVVDKIGDCNVLVTDKIRKTTKFLLALCRQVPIVDARWLEESESAGHFLELDAFLLDDPAYTATNGFAFTTAMERAKQGPVLKNHRLAFLLEPKEEADMVKIATSAGAEDWMTQSILKQQAEDEDTHRFHPGT